MKSIWNSYIWTISEAFLSIFAVSKVKPEDFKTEAGGAKTL